MTRPLAQRIAGFAQSEIRRMTRECHRLGGVNLGQGICQLPTPEPVREAAAAAIAAGHSQYSYPEGIALLRLKIAAKLARDNELVADPEQEIVVTSGASGVFTAALHALFDAGDELLMFEPFYGYHWHGARLAGLRPRAVPLAAPGFCIDEDQLAESIGPLTRGIVLCTPSNPTGHMLTRAEIEAVARVAEQHDLWVITDEIYESIRYEGRPHISPGSLASLRQRTVSIMGLSKTFSITGWRLGYAVAPPEVAKAMTLVHDLFYICAPTPLQHGVAAGFDLPESYFENMRADYARRRAALGQALASAGLEPHYPEGAYYMLADASALGEASANGAAMKLLEATGVAAVPGSAFYDGSGGERLLRFCFACRDEILDQAIERLAAFRA